MIAEYDLIMQGHVRRIQSKEKHHHYLGPQIQNELISVKTSIIRIIKEAKYFSNPWLYLKCEPTRKNEFDCTFKCVYWYDKHRGVYLEFLKVDDAYELGIFN